MVFETTPGLSLTSMHPRHLLLGPKLSSLSIYPLQLEYKALNVSTAISSHLLVLLASRTHNAFHSSPGVKILSHWSLPRFEGAQILYTLAGAKLVSHVHPRI